MAWAYGPSIDDPAPFLEGDVVSIEYVDGKLAANLQEHRIEYLPISEMPQHLVDALWRWRTAAFIPTGASTPGPWDAPFWSI